MDSLINNSSGVDPLHPKSHKQSLGRVPVLREGSLNKALTQSASEALAKPEQGAERSSLVNITKLCDTKRIKASHVRSTNYSLRRVSQEVLGHNHRVFTCQKVPSYGVQKLSQSRGISKNKDGKAFYHGLGSCGDVHACPVCSVKISEGRRQEVIHALRSHSESGYISLFATFTIRHSREDSLAGNLEAFRNARSDLIRSRKYRLIKDRLKMSGYIRRLEVTWGKSNGWHPHDHEVWLIDADSITPEELLKVKKEVFDLWSYYCVKYGLEAPSFEYGFDLRWKDGNGSDSVGAYLTKWGHELTYGHTKQANGEDRHTPFSMLMALKEKYSPDFVALYQEYATAFKGRAQLLWSRGLKDKFGVQEMSDGELSEMPEKEHYMDLDSDQAFRISFLNRFSTVLDYAEFCSPEVTRKYIASLFEESDAKLINNVRRRRKNYVSDIKLSNMLDAGIYEQGFT